VSRAEALVNFVASGTAEAETRAPQTAQNRERHHGTGNPQQRWGGWIGEAAITAVSTDVVCGAESALHVRYLHRRIVESVRACRVPAVAEAPSRSYNPLFIYGGVGSARPT
jgi:hypothetical protein